MKNVLPPVFSMILLLLLFAAPCTGAAGHPDPAEIRREFETAFGNQKIYQVIKKHLPQKYEEFFQAYQAARLEQKDADFRRQMTGFVNSIRNSHLKQSSDAAILDFYRHIVTTGRDIFRRDPNAAFSYVFGGDPSSYSEYLNYPAEFDALGDLFEQVLSTSTSENMKNFDQEDAEDGLTFVFVGLYYKYGDRVNLLNNRELNGLTEPDRRCLCDIYLNMYEEIFKLEPPTRNYVLRSLVLSM